MTPDLLAQRDLDVAAVLAAAATRTEVLHRAKDLLREHGDTPAALVAFREEFGTDPRLRGTFEAARRRMRRGRPRDHSTPAPTAPTGDTAHEHPDPHYHRRTRRTRRGPRH